MGIHSVSKASQRQSHRSITSPKESKLFEYIKFSVKRLNLHKVNFPAHIQ